MFVSTRGVSYAREDDVQEFLHVLVFRCPKCSRPLAVSCISDKRTLEAADAHLFNPHCHCGWTGSLAGFIAAKHWVEPWEPLGDTKTIPGEDESCDGKSLSE
jgi:hypothetical protein